MTILLLIRHGQNDFVGKRLAGRLPGVHLNEKGRTQARAVADLLRDAPIKAIYSSPLERAVQTAEPLAQTLNLPVQMHSGLLEVDFGDWAGKSIRQLARTKLWKVVQENPAGMQFPGGETFAAAQQRVTAAMSEIAACHEDMDLVACYSHSDTLRLALASFLEMPLNAFQRIAVDTASISVVHVGKSRPSIITMNYVPGMNFKPPEPRSTRKKNKQTVAQ